MHGGPLASTTNRSRLLEAEAIHVIREVAAEFERPCWFSARTYRHAAPGAGGLATAVPGHARRHRSQLRRSYYLTSRRVAAAASADDIDAGRVVETIPCREIRIQTRDAAAGHPGEPIRRRHFREPGAMRRRPRAASVGVQLPRRVRLGRTQLTKAGTVGTLQLTVPQGRVHPVKRRTKNEPRLAVPKLSRDES